MNAKRITPELAAQLYAEGLPLSQLALRFGTTKEAVRKVLKRAGVVLRPRGGYQGGRKRG